MPAVAAKKPTAYREGRADKTKKPSIEIEVNPEGEEEEEGMEGQEMDAAKTNRKRSAKGAKSTKAPMDGDCGCGGGKAKKCTCDGGCGGYAKKMERSDALTPQEYLAACDLGIQGRSRSYIRARLDAAERLDLKCGKGSISPGEKCTKGKGNTARAKGKGKTKRSQTGPMYNAASQWQANMRAANRAQLGMAAWNSGGPVGVRAAKNIWADGFDPVDERSDLKCGKGSISPGEKCTKGQAQAVDPKAAAKKEFRTLMNDPRAANAFNKAKGNTEGIGNKIKRVGEFAARLGGGAAIGAGLMQTYEGALQGNIGAVSRGYRNMTLGAAAIQTAAASKAGRMGKKELAKEFLKSAGRNAAVGVGQEAALGAYAGFSRTGGMAGLKRRTRAAYQSARMRTSGMRSTPHGTGWASSAYDRPLRGRRDSIYAPGFSPELDQLAI